MRILVFWFFTFLSLSCLSQQVNIIPQPVSVTVGNGNFVISKKTVLTARNDDDRKTAALFNDYLQQYYGFKLDIDKQESKDYIRFSTKQFVKAPDKDGYTLNVAKEGVTIEGDSYTGTFYGMQSLIQLLPMVHKNEVANSKLQVPFVSIQDAPRFSYRGLHLDVGRHFFPASFVKKYIDYIALHKLNYFHWHLTEDQGWRIEIKKYPRLTEVGGYRNGTIVGRYPGLRNDNERYGGFYTQEEVKDIVKYAADRHITVIPEIEMPGHSSAAIAAYPFLSCFPDQPTKIPGKVSTVSQQTGGKLVQETWGVFDDVYCAGKDSTFGFLQDVLDEVLALFPSKYIHIGGDESPKANWKKCPNCQKRIKDLGLKDEHELQSYFIQRMEKYLNSKGRTIIGWDEILEGGLAPNAWLMSWRGEKGGIEAAKQKHNVIMTPQNPVYFDHTQSQDEDSVTIGGYNPIEKVYAYDPLPAELSADEAKYIVGAQANVWTEYMGYPSKVEYMLFPRIAALSEVLWSAKEKKSWPDFEKRLNTQFARYQMWGVNYSNAFYDIKSTVSPAPDNKGLSIKFDTKDKGGKITYGIGGKHYQKLYTTPVSITDAGLVTALYTRDGKVRDSVDFLFHFNKATGKKITLKEKPSSNYPGDGAFTLVNGIQNTKGLTKGREFIAYNGGDLEAAIDLGMAQKISEVTVHTLEQAGSWIYRPQSVEVFSSMDGADYKSIGTSSTFITSGTANGVIKVAVNNTNTRYVKVVVKNNGMITDGNAGAGNKAWLFCDEIEVN